MAIWLPGLFVAIAAAVATAHGLFEVAVASGLPSAIAWLYPLITDGLALVAYASTTRLDGSAGRYAWTVVVIAAGLSGLAQACYLGGGVDAVAPAQLRFGVGAWPAIAAAIVAHLLYLLVASNPVQRLNVRLDTPVQRDTQRPTEPAERAAVGRSEHVEPLSVEPPDGGLEPTLDGPVQTLNSPSEAPARARAQAAAHHHAARHGELPTVSQLMTLAGVSRGTAGEALKTLRNQPTPLHLVTPDENTRTNP